MTSSRYKPPESGGRWDATVDHTFSCNNSINCGTLALLWSVGSPRGNRDESEPDGSGFSAGAADGWRAGRCVGSGGCAQRFWAGQQPAGRAGALRCGGPAVSGAHRRRSTAGGRAGAGRAAAGHGAAGGHADLLRRHQHLRGRLAAARDQQPGGGGHPVSAQEQAGGRRGERACRPAAS